LPASVSKIISSKQARNGRDPGKGQLTMRLGGKLCSIHFSLLNPGSMLPKAYQVATFPLTELEDDLNEMRRNAITVSLIALGVSFVMALLLSRGLSGPVRSLSKAAHEIGEGDFEARRPSPLQ